MIKAQDNEMESCRKRFEEWCKINKADFMEKWDGKPYVDYIKTEIAWSAWQAAWKAKAERKATSEGVE